MTPAEIGQALVDYVTAVVAQNDAITRAETAERARLRAEGYRLVGAGQDDAEGHWTVTDDETGEVLAMGRGVESYHAATHPEWYHVDHILEAVPDGLWALPPLPPTLPPGVLGDDPRPERLREWLTSVTQETRS